MSEQPTQELEIPKLGIIKARWNAERAIWLAHRATSKLLIAASAYENLDILMDFALDSGYVQPYRPQIGCLLYMVEPVNEPEALPQV